MAMVNLPPPPNEPPEIRPYEGLTAYTNHQGAGPPAMGRPCHGLGMICKQKHGIFPSDTFDVGLFLYLHKA